MRAKLHSGDRRRRRSKLPNTAALLLSCPACRVRQQVFCRKHPELAQHFLHAHAAIFTSAASSTLGCCSISRDAAAAEVARSSSSNAPSVRQVTPQEAAATVFNTQRPQSITALLIDRAHGKTVQQRMKDRAFADISYVADLLLQLVPVLALLQQELGFNHDDLRLPNIIETWEHQHSPAGRQAQAQAQPSTHSAAQAVCGSRGYGKLPAHGAAGGSRLAYPAVLYGAAPPAGATEAAAQQPGQAALHGAAAGRDAARVQAAPGGFQLLGRGRGNQGVELSTAGPPRDSSSRLQQGENGQAGLPGWAGGSATGTDDSSSSSSSVGGGSSSAVKVAGAASAPAGGRVMFKLFDFGLSMVNPDKFSMGQQAHGSRQEKQEALRSLREQGKADWGGTQWVQCAWLALPTGDLGRHLSTVHSEASDWPA